jgi:hypothetical protein
MGFAEQSNTDDGIGFLSGLFEPKEHKSVCDWVEANVELPTGAIRGNVQLDRIPYWKEPLERIGDRATRNLVAVAPTQSGKTTFLSSGMLFRIAELPEDAMWIFGNADQARDFNKERFMPFTMLCKAVERLIPKTTKGVIDKRLWGNLNQHYQTMVLNFVGAGSRTNLSSRPRGLIFMDETDKYHEELKFDAGTIQLAEERMKSFPFPLSVKASSPSEETRMIWAEFLKTDQRQFWLPCPRCGEKILFRFDIESEKHGDCGLRWWHEHPDEAKTDGEWDVQKIRKNAFYKCQKCAGMVHDHERYEMLQSGVWIPKNPRADEGNFGYHINSLYSILSPETSFGSIAVKFIKARKNRLELKNFINGWLAEPWNESMAYKQKKIEFEVFGEQNKPTEESVPIMAADYQVNGFWVLVRRFEAPSEKFPYGQSWLLYADWVQTKEEIAEIKQEYMVEGEDAVLDMAKRPNQAGRIILELGIRGMWGSPNTKLFWHRQPDGTRVSRPYSVVQYRDPMLGTKWENQTFERAIYVNFSKESALDALSALRHYSPTIWHASANVNPVYTRHINAFQKRYQKNRRTGRMEWEWINVHNDDHLADCEAMATIRAMQRGLIVIPPETQV